MTITLQTDRKMTQLVQNAEDLYASIGKYYNILHSDRTQGSGLLIQFGRHPIKENHIEFSSFNGGRVTLYVREVAPELIERITGLRPVELGKNQDALREEKGNSIANAYASTFQDKINAFFRTDTVTMNIDTYMSAKCALKIDVSHLTHEVLDAVSEILKYSGLTPKIPSTRQYEL
tara:strand:- start:367768 stop:368295 length:528 start_codon:yes stop_codon:yes gene_type:complete